jgi:uncharacterized protein (TIGR00290 family)
VFRVSREPVALSWSGGKDSSLALASLRTNPGYEVVALLTSITAGYDRVSIHGVRRALVNAQADSLGLSLVEITVEPQCSNDAYEAAFKDALLRMKHEYPEIQRIAFGDLYLADVREYREQLLRKTQYEPIFPIWGSDTRVLASSFIASGFRAHLACVDTEQLDPSFAGRTFDEKLLGELPCNVDPCGENGEFHTFVSDGPIFTKPIAVTVGEIVLRDNRFAFADLLPEQECTDEY